MNYSYSVQSLPNVYNIVIVTIITARRH